MTEIVPFGLMASSSIPIAAAEEITAEYCLRFLRQIRDVVFSTVDAQGLPSARVIDVMHVEHGRLYFMVPRGKAFHAEITRNPTCAIVGQTTDFRVCRLRGTAVRVPDSDQRRVVDMLFDLNPGMDMLYPGKSRYICAAFYIQDGAGDYFDLGQKPLVRATFELGEGTPRMGGSYAITSTCTDCGTCAQVCPQDCIEHVGETFRINQTACPRCGLCQEACPQGAIEKQ